MKRVLAACFVVLFFAVQGFCAASGTPKEAKALADKAVAFIKANGKDRAMEEFNNPKGKFIDRDLYIFAVQYDGLVLSHSNAKLIGKDVIGLKDSDGMYFIKAMIDLAKTKHTGWLDYKWQNPVTKKIEAKTSYIYGMDGYFVACGAYK